jgi:hypothetical protein
MSTYKETPRVTAGLPHASSPSLPFRSALRRWNLRVQWTIAVLSAIGAIMATWCATYVCRVATNWLRRDACRPLTLELPV